LLKKTNKIPTLWQDCQSLIRAFTAVYYQNVFSLLKVITLRQGSKRALYPYYWHTWTKK